MTRMKKGTYTYSWAGKQVGMTKDLIPDNDIFPRGLQYHPDTIHSKFEGWSETAIELWHDLNFISQRIAEQKDYLDDLNTRYRKGHMDLDRKLELYASAAMVGKVFALRKQELLYGKPNPKG